MVPRAAMNDCYLHCDIRSKKKLVIRQHQDARNGAEFVIRKSNIKLPMIDGLYLFKTSISCAFTGAGILYARQDLEAKRIFNEDDYATVIDWIQEAQYQLMTSLLLHDI